MDSGSTETTVVAVPLLVELHAALAVGDSFRARALAEKLVEEDALLLLEGLNPDELSHLFTILGDESLGDLISRLNDHDAADILERMSAAQAADILEEIDPDDATDIFAEVAPDLRADQTVAALRKVAEEAETVNYVYVTDPDEHLLGVLSLHKLVLTRPETRVRDLMFHDPVTVRVDTDQEVAA